MMNMGGCHDVRRNGVCRKANRIRGGCSSPEWKIAENIEQK